MKYINDINAPQPVYDWLVNNEYSRGESTWSVTQLIDSPRVRILKEEHEEAMEIPVSSLLASSIGTAIHNGVEAHTLPPLIAEERVFVDIDGLVLSGAIDLQIQEEGKGNHLIDYKSCKAYAVIFGKPEWEKQLNGYAWMMRKNNVDVERLSVFAFIVDWTKNNARRNKDYPQANMLWIDVPLWSFEDQEKYFAERIALHTDTEFRHIMGEPLPHCSPQERWEKDEKWAVKKNKNKAALKLFDNEADATEHQVSLIEKGDGHTYWIEHRPGTPIRCADYCHVAQFCTQYQEEIED
jgi:hypothetical protein